MGQRISWQPISGQVPDGTITMNYNVFSNSFVNYKPGTPVPVELQGKFDETSWQQFLTEAQDTISNVITKTSIYLAYSICALFTLTILMFVAFKVPVYVLVAG